MIRWLSCAAAAPIWGVGYQLVFEGADVLGAQGFWALPLEGEPLGAQGFCAAAGFWLEEGAQGFEGAHGLLAEATTIWPGMLAAMAAGITGVMLAITVRSESNCLRDFMVLAFLNSK
jgi:hypothetical protein